MLLVKRLGSFELRNLYIRWVVWFLLGEIGNQNSCYRSFWVYMCFLLWCNYIFISHIRRVLMLVVVPFRSILFGYDIETTLVIGVDCEWRARSILLDMTIETTYVGHRLRLYRFGHDAIASCEHCSKFEDYALFALAPVLLSYVFEALLIGVSLGPSLSFFILLCLTFLYATPTLAYNHQKFPSGTTPNTCARRACMRRCFGDLLPIDWIGCFTTTWVEWDRVYGESFIPIFFC